MAPLAAPATTGQPPSPAAATAAAPDPQGRRALRRRERTTSLMPPAQQQGTGEENDRDKAPKKQAPPVGGQDEKAPVSPPPLDRMYTRLSPDNCKMLTQGRKDQRCVFFVYVGVFYFGGGGVVCDWVCESKTRASFPTFHPKLTSHPSCIYLHSSDLAPTNPTGQFEERGVELYLAYIRQPDPPGEEPKLAYRCVIFVSMVWLGGFFFLLCCWMLAPILVYKS